MEFQTSGRRNKTTLYLRVQEHHVSVFDRIVISASTVLPQPRNIDLNGPVTASQTEVTQRIDRHLEKKKDHRIR